MGDLCRQPILLKSVRKDLVVVNNPEAYIDRPFCLPQHQKNNLGSEIYFIAIFYVRTKNNQKEVLK